MNSAEAMRLYGELYSPKAEDLRQPLPDIADGLHAQLIELHKRPSADRCERLAANLDGARRTVLQYRERLISEGEAA